MKYSRNDRKKQAPPPKRSELTAREFLQLAALLQARQRQAASTAPTVHRLRAVVGGL